MSKYSRLGISVASETALLGAPSIALIKGLVTVPNSYYYRRRIYINTQEYKDCRVETYKRNNFPK